MSNEPADTTDLLHYRIIAKIGSGGMGDVYRAEDTKLGRKVAIKFLNESRSSDPEKLGRFVQEAKAASALNHPHILTVHEIGEADGKHYIATELIEGRTLRSYIANKETLPLSKIFRMAIQVADALTAAHNAGIIHRDIKPENIMIRDDGYAKVVDFGLAKLTENSPAVESSVKTSAGVIMGTVSYMSPEQARGRDLDPRTDIYSLGVVLYELLTGRTPFTGETFNHEIVAILEQQPQHVAAFNAAAPAELAVLTMSLLAKAPNDRPATAALLAEDLRTLRKKLEFEEELERTFSPDSKEETRRLSAAYANPASTGNTIAVLPFLNLSNDENGDYFSDGLAEELLNVLAKIRGLRVAARTSAFSFKGKQTTVAEIGRTLNVASVLEGSIRTAGNRVRIAVQLVKVADGYHLWSETYDRTMDDIFAVQDDIAESVVEELRTRLLGEKPGRDNSSQVEHEVAEAVKGRADNPEAQRLMLLGRYMLDRTTRGDTERAIHYFSQAVELDPNYALGWAELGRAYSVQAGKNWTQVETGYADARTATERALELEPDLAEAHAQLGRIQSAYDMDMTAARASYKRALELAPGDPIVLDGASILEFKFGNLDAALEMSRRVLSQDPLSSAIWHNLGLICHSAGLLTESESAFKKALELGRERTVTSAMLSLVLLNDGRQTESLEMAEREPDEFWSLWAKAIILPQIGRREDGDAAFNELIALHEDGDAYQLAEVCAIRGEVDAALEWLDRAFAERDPGITHSKTSPRLQSLHDDARWPAFLARIGLAG